MKFGVPGPHNSLQCTRLSAARIHTFNTGQAYACSNKVYSCTVASASQTELEEGNRWLLKGEEKKNRRSGRNGWGKEGTRRRIREGRSIWFCSSHLPQHSPCWLPACSLANTAASDKEQPLSYSGGAFHVPYCKLYWNAKCLQERELHTH